MLTSTGPRAGPAPPCRRGGPTLRVGFNNQLPTQRVRHPGLEWYFLLALRRDKAVVRRVGDAETTRIRQYKICSSALCTMLRGRDRTTRTARRFPRMDSGTNAKDKGKHCDTCQGIQVLSYHTHSPPFKTVIQHFSLLALLGEEEGVNLFLCNGSHGSSFDFAVSSHE